MGLRTGFISSSKETSNNSSIGSIPETGIAPPSTSAGPHGGFVNVYPPGRAVVGGGALGGKLRKKEEKEREKKEKKIGKKKSSMW